MAGNYEKEKLIGAGTFGKAWLVHSKSSGKKYVMKEIQVTGMSDKDKTQALTEVEILGRCKHINIIRYKEAFVDQGVLAICMEYAEQGDLYKRIKEQKNNYFEEKVILDWFVQICFGLRYIHSQNILHRDLKTQNLFLTGDNTVKLGDFGIARVLQGNEDYAMTAVGTPYYLSPEICKQQPYNHKSDMWATGCVLYELATLLPPFQAADFSALVCLILQARFKPIPGHYSSLVDDLVSVLLRVSAEGRPSAEQILTLPALQSYVNAYVQRQSNLRKAGGNTPQTPRESPSTTVGKKPPQGRKRSEQMDKENIGHGPRMEGGDKIRKTSVSSSPSSPKPKRTPLQENIQTGNKVKSQEKKTPVMNLYRDMIRKKKNPSQGLTDGKIVSASGRSNSQDSPVNSPVESPNGIEVKATPARNDRNLGNVGSGPSVKKETGEAHARMQIKHQANQRQSGDRKGCSTYTIKEKEYLSREHSMDVNKLLYERNLLRPDSQSRNVEVLQAFLVGRLGGGKYVASCVLIDNAIKREFPFSQVQATLPPDVLDYFPLFIQLLQNKTN